MSAEDSTDPGRLFVSLRLAAVAVILVSAGLVCGSDGAGGGQSGQSWYDFSAPDTVFALPARLDEISGITLLSDSVLAAVEDEHGRIYHIDTRSGVVLGRFRFGDDGDYEDIELRGDSLWVLDSDGDLFALPAAGKHRAHRTETPLTAAFDTEGLATDPLTGELWILAKEYPGDGLDGYRAVYAFNTASLETRPEPALLLDLRTIEARRHKENIVSRTVRSIVRPLMDLDRFRPAALEFTVTGDTLLVVSSTDPLMVVAHRSGRILETHTLPGFLRQPEALAMAPCGDLYVGTEAAGDRAYIALFKRRVR